MPPAADRDVDQREKPSPIGVDARGLGVSDERARRDVGEPIVAARSERANVTSATTQFSCFSALSCQLPQKQMRDRLVAPGRSRCR